MSESAIHLAFEKLEGRESYNNWKFGMKMALIHENLWAAIEGYPEEDTTSEVEKKRRDQKALAKICLMIKSSAYAYVRSAENAKEAWSNLQKAYEDKGLSRRLTLLRTLSGMKLQNFKNMELYVSEIMSISQKLADMDAALDDEFVAVIMLSGLTEDYNPMVMALESANIRLTSDFVKAKLLQDIKYSNSSSEKALYSKNNKVYNKRKVVCYKCLKEGHLKYNCPNKRENKDNVKDKQEKTTSKKDKADKALLVSVKNSDSEDWYIDSGATTHLSNKKDWFENFNSNTSHNIAVASGHKLKAYGTGDVLVSTRNGPKRISEVVYVPDLKTNLLSVSKMIKNNYIVIFNSEGCQVYDTEDCSIEGEVVVTASIHNGLYKLDTEELDTEVGNLAKHLDGEDIWHRRLGHLNRISMNLLKQGLATGVSFADEKGEQCIACLQGKQTRKPFKRIQSSRARNLLEIIHSDLCGPMPDYSWSGKRYILTFIDDFSRKVHAYFLASKNEVYSIFKEYQVMVENETGHTIKVLRTDNGREYLSQEFKAYLKSKGIRHQFTIPYTPEQNGVAERFNRTIVEKARCMMHVANCDHKMWAEAVNTAVYLKNRSPHKIIKGATPQEIWTGKKIDLSHLKVFGCLAYVHVPKNLRNKWDAKGKPYIFVGYCEDSKGYRLFDIEDKGKIIRARDVVFLENKFSIEERSEADNNLNSYIHLSNEDKEVLSSEEDIQQNDIRSERRSEEDEEEFQSLTDQEQQDAEEDNRETENRHQDHKDQDQEDQDNDKNQDQEDQDNVGEDIRETERRYPKRNRSSKKFSDYFLFQATCEPSDPKNLTEVLKRDDHDKWKEAMRAELHSMAKNKVWTLVDPPENQKIVKNKWVFRTKRNTMGEIVKYKARLVAKGFTQEYGVDYYETFSPVVRHSSIRLLIALSAELNLNIDHLDVDTAFLNGELSEKIYMYQPKGFIDSNNKEKVCLLKRAIYGLKQSSRVWNKKVENVLEKLGFKKSNYEACIYFKVLDKSIIIIALYVDDFLIFSNDEKDCLKLKDQLMKCFKIKDLGKAKRCLGLNIHKDNFMNTISINQKDFIQELLVRFNLTEAKDVVTPMEVGSKLNYNEKENIDVPYQQLIGALMFLAVNTRPDIAFVTSYLSQFNLNHDAQHWKAAKRILRYLKGTIDYSLTYQKTNSLNVVGFCDADWANDLNDRKSYTGFVFILGNGAISWEARKQRLVALSSTEAEYIALSESAKEAIHLKGLLNELISYDEKIILCNDNQSAQKLACNPVFHNKTKHIEIKYHFVRQTVDRNLITLKYVSTDKMIADIFTKSLNGPKHKFCTKGLGLKRF